MKLDDLERRKLKDVEALLRHYCTENNLEWVTITIGTTEGEVSVGLPAACDEFHMLEIGTSLADFLEHTPPMHPDDEDEDDIPDDVREEMVQDVRDYITNGLDGLARARLEVVGDDIFAPDDNDSDETDC